MHWFLLICVPITYVAAEYSIHAALHDINVTIYCMYTDNLYHTSHDGYRYILATRYNNFIAQRHYIYYISAINSTHVMYVFTPLSLYHFKSTYECWDGNARSRKQIWLLLKKKDTSSSYDYDEQFYFDYINGSVHSVDVRNKWSVIVLLAFIVVVHSII